MATPDAALRDLSDVAARVLDEFVAAAREAFGHDLVSIVLFGSAAEGALRATSDVNVIVVLRAFDRGSRDALLFNVSSCSTEPAVVLCPLIPSIAGCSTPAQQGSIPNRITMRQTTRSSRARTEARGRHRSSQGGHEPRSDSVGIGN